LAMFYMIDCNDLIHDVTWVTNGIGGIPSTLWI
jgi:hypothetical protein